MRNHLAEEVEEKRKKWSHEEKNEEEDGNDKMEKSECESLPTFQTCQISTSTKLVWTLFDPRPLFSKWRNFDSKLCSNLKFFSILKISFSFECRSSWNTGLEIRFLTWLH